MKVGTAKATSKSWDGARSLLSVFARKKYDFRFAREVVKYTPFKICSLNFKFHNPGRRSTERRVDACHWERHMPGMFTFILFQSNHSH